MNVDFASKSYSWTTHYKEWPIKPISYSDGLNSGRTIKNSRHSVMEGQGSPLTIRRVSQLITDTMQLFILSRVR